MAFFRCTKTGGAAPAVVNDINWERTLVDEWNFKEGLTSKNGHAFVIDSGAAQSANGLLFTAADARVHCDLAGLISDWTNADIEIEIDPNIFSYNSVCEFWAFNNDRFNNYSAGAYWAGTNGLKIFYPNENNFINGTVSQLKMCRNLCCKITASGVEFYGMGYYIGENTALIGANINTQMSGSATNIYIGSGYGSWSPNGMIYKSLKIYERSQTA